MKKITTITSHENTNIFGQIAHGKTLEGKPVLFLFVDFINAAERI
jgi:hypothetical protein